MFLTALRSFCSLIFCLLFTLASTVGTIGIPCTDELPSVPDDFTPAIRFVVFTDNHSEVNNQYDATTGRVIKMINTCFDMYGDEGIDLFACCGDFTEYGKDEQVKDFTEAFFGTINGRAKALVVMGNHDLKMTDNAAEHFRNEFQFETGEQSIEVKGFHFIGVPSYLDGAIQIIPQKTVNWAQKELKSALKESDNLPVFTFQHPHNRSTVYGSTIWGCDSLSRVWNKSTRVVNFSGHSHFPIEDPRSIWQGSYTAVGVGGLAKFELEKDLIWNQHPAGYNKAAEFYVVEADNDGSVKMSAFDLNTNSFFLTYYIDNVNDPTTFAYTCKNMKKYDEAPEFEQNAKVTYETNDAGETLITFDKAKDKLVVQNYKIEVHNHLGICVYSKTTLSDYYLHGTEDTMTVNLGKLKLKQGKDFSVKIYPANAYSEIGSPLKAIFTMK